MPPFPMRTPSRQQPPLGAPARSRRRRPRAMAAIAVAALLVLAVAPAAAATPRSPRASHPAVPDSRAIPASWFRGLPFLRSGDVRVAAPRIAAASADLTVTVTDAPDPVVAGGSITYTIDVANAGPDIATATVLTFTLAPTTTFTSSTPGPGTCAEVAGVVTCALGDIANGGSTSVAVVVATTVVGTPGPATATVMSAVPDPTAGNSTASASTTVTDPADLSTTLDDATTTFTPGTTLTFTMGVTNAGPWAAAAGVVVVGHAPAGTTPHTTDPECVVNGTDVTCTTTTPLAAA